MSGITGYVMARESGFTGNEILIDPFMGSGVIIIEAALFSQKLPVRYYDKDKLAFTKLGFFKKIQEDFFKAHDSCKNTAKKSTIYGFDSQLRYLKAVQKNAKLAGINLNLSKKDVSWLDTKFEKASVDFIVTDPPRMSKNKDLSRLKKTYNELFYQAEYILKKSSKIVLLAKSYSLLENAAKNHSFKLKKNYLLYQGKEQFNLLVFEKNS